MKWTVGGFLFFISLLVITSNVIAGVIQCPTRLNYTFKLESKPTGKWKSKIIDKESWAGIRDVLSATIEGNSLVCSYNIEGAIVKVTQSIPPGSKCQIEFQKKIKMFSCF